MKSQKSNMWLLVAALILSVSSAGAVEFDWAVIDNAGNAGDNTGYGAVAYEYRVATTEVTAAQYVEFLNAVAATDTYGLYNPSMNGSVYQGIIRSGDSGSYTYTANAGYGDRPVVFVSWYNALRFANWMQNGQPTGLQNASTTEYGVYDMTLGGLDIARLDGAQVWLPNENEWYKAAYYDPINGVYYDYATGTDSLPNNNLPESDTGNSVNYNDALGEPYNTTEVGAYEDSASPYGTYDQSGNVWEWIEDLDGYKCVLRGSSYARDASYLPSSYRISDTPGGGYSDAGFRIASSLSYEYDPFSSSIPEPMSMVLLLLSIVSLVLRRARKA